MTAKELHDAGLDIEGRLKGIEDAQSWAVRTLIGSVLTVIVLFICAGAGTIILANGNGLLIENLTTSFNEFKADMKDSIKEANSASQARFLDIESRLRVVESTVTTYHGTKQP